MPPDIPSLVEQLPEDTSLWFEAYHTFLSDTEDAASRATPEMIQQRLREMERFVGSSDRVVYLYGTSQETFSCARVENKRVGPDGELVSDTRANHYLVGVPFKYATESAPESFLRAEVAHEIGHAAYTPFHLLRKDLTSIEAQDGAELAKVYSMLVNCVEDPRMERLVGGPLNQVKRDLLFRKNKLLIFPNITEGLPQMPAYKQLLFLIKLERLWTNHQGAEISSEAAKLWSPDDILPEVKAAYEEIEPLLVKITGNQVEAPCRIATDMMQIIKDQIYPIVKSLYEEYPHDNPESDSNEGSESQTSGRPGEGSDGEQVQGIVDPEDPSTWPEDLKKLIETHKQRIQAEADKAKQKFIEKQKSLANTQIDANSELAKSEGFLDPELFQEYERLRSEVEPIIQRLRLLFEEYLPRIDELLKVHKNIGTRFSVSRYIRSLGTGRSDVMSKKAYQETRGLVFQLLIDVSGSMYSQKERIRNAVLAGIALMEASEGFNLSTEVLASDDHNFSDDSKYEIKCFEDEYDASIKARMVTILNSFGGDNEDARAIVVALPRAIAERDRVSELYDKMAALMLFISDSTTESSDTLRAANTAREQVPLEGMAIENNPSIVAGVRANFDADSIVPRSVEEFPSALEQILLKYIATLER